MQHQSLLVVALSVLACHACSGRRDPPVPTLQVGTPELVGRIAMELSHAGETHIWVVDADGQNLMELDPVGRTRQPRFSRDGTRLAFVTSSYRIGIQDLVHNQRQVLEVSGHSPTWSPNGDRLAWVDDTGSVRVRDLATGLDRVLLVAQGFTAIEWSPTQDLILVAGSEIAPGGSFHPGLQMLDLEGRLSTPFASWFKDARWSPDGRMIGSSNGVVDTRGRLVAGNATLGLPLAWSPDGKGFVGWTESLGRMHFAVFDFAGNRLVVLPLPPDHFVPTHIDFGYYWVDWSWN